MGTGKRHSKSLLVVAFGAIATIIVIAQIVAYLQWREVQSSVDLIEGNALASIRLVQRLGLDVQRQRILIDRHIFENNSGGMREIEVQISAIESDFAGAAKLYSPLATFAGEASAWRELTLAVAELAPKMRTALALSRVNADADARAAIATAEPTYDAVERDVNALVAINQHAAENATATVDALQERVLLLRLGFAAVVLILTLILGVWVTSAIGRREREVAAQAVTLENRNRELDAFAGRVAHDLRGPLNAIKLSGSLLAEEAPTESRTATIQRRAIGQMEQLIEDLLTLARVDGQGIGKVARTDQVAAVIEEDLAPRVKEVGGTLSIDIRPAHVRCSEGLLRQVLWNLGENAVKYRRPDTALVVEMTGKQTPSDYEIRVRDNGAGMTPDEAHAAFEPFFRGAQPRPIPGTGLGLSIVRRIVEANGGIISLDSVAGHGTTVVIHLPFAA